MISLTFAQDTGGTVDDGGGVTDGGFMDGGVTDGGFTDGGGMVGGCLDNCADNYNPEASFDDMSCIYTNCECLYASNFISQYFIYQCFLGVMSGESCTDMTSYGYDCSFVESCGLCASQCNDEDDDGVCDEDEISGCQDSEACNYNAEATDPGECNYPQNNYDCNGNCIAETDCLGNCGGNASYDECGVCNGDGIPEGACNCEGDINDCNGVCGGSSTLDECGICGGNGIAEGACDCEGNVTDCAGVCGGNSTLDECGECGGNGPQYQCWNDAIVCNSSDCSEQPQEFDIDLSLSFPLDEAQITDYSNVNIEWTYEGTANDSIYISVEFSHNYGGGLKTVADGIRIQSQSATVDLTTYANGEPICENNNSSCIETIFGKIKIIATDISTGDSSETESESIIIGNPEGDIGINWLDEDNNALVIDWGWITNQNIIILEDAFLDIEDFTTLKIADLQGVFDSSCSNADSSDAISLIQIPLTEVMQSELLWGVSYTLDCGADYCYENGGRIPGYNEGNQVHFYASDDTGYEIEVYPSTLDGQVPYFNNASITVTGFELGGNTDGGANTGGGENCEDAYLDDCSGDGDCCPESWIGDGYGDCEEQQYGCDLTCYDFDGGDCSDNTGCILPNNSVTLTDNGSVLYNVDFDIGGFQWNVEGASIISASGGTAEEAGFTVSSGGSTLLGFSFTGSTIEAGCDTLTNMQLEGDASRLSQIVFANSEGQPILVEYYNGAMSNNNDLPIKEHLDTYNNIPLLTIDDRDFDGFSIYNKVTSVRDCDNPGEDENEGWCFEETVYDQTSYTANIPYMQQSVNVKYRVWLLDTNGNEVLKTLDTDGIDIYYVELDDIFDKSLAFGWNWFSLNMSADDMGINTVLSSLDDAGVYIKSQSQYADYYAASSLWSGTLNDFDNLSMYKINLTGSSGNITYTGTTITPSTLPLTINSGWNWVSYVPNESIDINTALASLGSDAIYIKSQSGYADYYPTSSLWSGTISTLDPKDGYMINAANATTLTYPDPAAFSRSHIVNEPSINEYKWNFDYKDFQNNGSVTIAIDDPDLNIAPGDQIAAFYNDECRGVAIGKESSLTDNIVFQLMFYGDENDANFTFKYYDVSENIVHNLENEIIYYPDIHLNNILEPFLMGKKEVLSLKLSSPYPNPFNPVTTIPYSIPEDVNNLKINIYDITGRLVDQIYNGNQSMGNHKLIWNASRYASGIYFVKMITDTDNISRKLILIK